MSGPIPSLLLLAALAGAQLPPEPAPPPALFRGDAARTGLYDTEPVRSLGGLQWRFQTGGPVRSTPAVAGDVVYVGSGDGHLYALDRMSGEELWRFDAGSSVASSPAVADGRVVFGDRDGRFRALDASDGREIWRLATGPDAAWAWGHESADVFTSSPAVVGDVVVLGAGDGRVRAVRAGDGAVLWETFVGGRVRSSPAVLDGVVAVGSADGSVHVLALEDGRVLDRLDTEGRALDSGDFGFDRKTVQSTPAVADDRIFVGAKDGHLYAFRRRARGSRGAPATATAPRREASGEDPAGAWLWRSDERISWILGGPAVVDGVVYAATSDARFVQAVDVRDGSELWRFDAPSSVWTSPAVAGDVVYAADNAGFVHALSRRTGESLWSYRTGGSVMSSPVPDRGMVFVGSDDGGVYALREGPPVRRAVFWDSTLVRAAWYRGHAELRDHLVERGYELLDAAGLDAFLARESASEGPSVVVFAMDVLPRAAGEGGAASPLRTYLEGGGKVVWVGVPPLLWTRDPGTGSPGDLTRVDRDATAALLGVDHGRGNFDAYGARPTREGRRWGLDGWWRSRWAAAPGPGLLPLAEDEQGLAAAWARSYGGPPGTGFVRIWGTYEAMPDPHRVHTVAEFRPSPEPEAAGPSGRSPGLPRGR